MWREVDDEIGGYRFRDMRLLTAALTHTSFVHESGERLTEGFERLEFLGDAVVNFVVGLELFRRYPHADEGELTQRRAQVVSRTALADAGERLGLLERARVVKGAGVKEPRYGFVTRLYESVAAAVFLDGGLEGAEQFIRTTLGRGIDEPMRRSPKSELQEFTQRMFGTTPEYRRVEAADPPSPSWYVFEAQIAGKTATGSGRSMREAQEEAASKLLEELTS